MGEPVKGTVTSLSSVFAPEDAQKASARVQETISERQKEVQQLQAFLHDNTSLVNLVKKLPDQLHHDIMVPFGKSAFFPGKLIHTNEFLVLLGEGYYADRTSKQTIEILKRRGNDLESKIETLNATIKDLKFEASFFDKTATEAEEGIVEIREEYVDEAANEERTTTSGDDDFDRIMSRMDELEKEELESQREEKDEADLSHLMSHTSLEPEVKSSEMKNEHSISTESSQTQQHMSKQSKPNDSPAFPVSKELVSSSHAKVPTSIGSSSPRSLVEHNKPKESSPHTLVPKSEVSTLASNLLGDNSSSNKSIIAPESKEDATFDSSSSNDRSKAFTGSIVERTYNIENNQKGQMPAPASKPVSRFKLQRK